MMAEPPSRILLASCIDGVRFHSFSCQLELGSGLVVLGHEGDALTELVDVLTGLVPAVTGDIKVWAEDGKLPNQKTWRKLTSPIGFVSGKSGLLDNLKVWENLILPLQTRLPQDRSADLEPEERQVFEAFAAAGIERTRCEDILASSPDEISPMERTVTEMTRCHLAGFRILVGEQVFEGTGSTTRIRIIRMLNWLGTRHPDTALLLIHRGDPPPELTHLRYWTPMETLTLHETP